MPDSLPYTKRGLTNAKKCVIMGDKDDCTHRLYQLNRRTCSVVYTKKPYHECSRGTAFLSLSNKNRGRCSRPCLHAKIKQTVAIVQAVADQVDENRGGRRTGYKTCVVRHKPLERVAGFCL